MALIALTSSDRGQTIHFMNIENIVQNEDSIDFIILDRLKTTKKIHKPKVIKCISSDIDGLNVKNYVSAYMERTLPLSLEMVEQNHVKPTQLFLSWATKQPVTRPTLTRWLKTCLKMAGINTDQFSGHSFRGAGLSCAYNNGASLSQIVSHGD